MNISEFVEKPLEDEFHKQLRSLKTLVLSLKSYNCNTAGVHQWAPAKN